MRLNCLTLHLLAAAALGVTARAADKFSLETTPGKLPKNVIPRSYLVFLDPDSEALALTGSEEVELEVVRPATRIVLNALHLQISHASLSDGEKRVDLQPQPDEAEETVTFPLPAELAPGKYTFSCAFSGKLQTEPKGFFVQTYRSQGATRKMLLTQLEATDARRMFPCWDEPAFKATFQLSAKLPRDGIPVSNTPVVAQQLFGSDDKIVLFAPTPAISTYLIVLAAGDFESIEDESNGIPLRILTVRGKKELGHYALEQTKLLLPYYTDLFGLSPSLQKLDEIAVPGGFRGSMENWGGIVFDEDRILFDPASSSLADEQRLFITLAHELAHQWFGNLVTLAWWNELWLNEGFATWMERKAVDHLHPEWHGWLHANDEKEDAMRRDAEPNTHPITEEVKLETQADDAFDEIAYTKAALVIRMLEAFVGPDRFRQGIQSYLAANRFSNVTAENLWEALEGTTTQALRRTAQSWFRQPGYPLVKMTAQCTGTHRTVSLEQARFSLTQRAEDPAQWSIPFAISSTDHPETVRYALLEKLSANFQFPGCDGVLKGGAGNKGFFRVWYEPALLSSLGEHVAELREPDRLNLISDVWAMVETGLTPPASYFELLQQLRNDDSGEVWHQIIASLSIIDRLEQGQPMREAFQQYCCSLLAPKFKQIGWTERVEDSPVTKLLRADLIQALGTFGDRAIIDEAFRRFPASGETPQELPLNLRPAVTFLAGRYSNPPLYDQLHELAVKSDLMENKRMYYYAMAAALDPDLAAQTLQALVTDDLSAEDASNFFGNVAYEGEHAELAWKFLLEQFTPAENRKVRGEPETVLPAVASAFTEEDRADELLELLQTHFPGTDLTEARRAAAQIRLWAGFGKTLRPAIEAWLKAEPVSADSPAGESISTANQRLNGRRR